jgi:cytochrome oxidase assembly protein ShyY1
VAQVLGPPAGFILGALLAAIFLALAAWQLGRRSEAYGPGTRPVDAAAVTPPRT